MNIQEFKSKKTVIFDKIDNYKNYRNWIIGKTDEAKLIIFFSSERKSLLVFTKL